MVNLRSPNRQFHCRVNCHTKCWSTCFKGDGGSCIDFLIAKSKFSFIKTNFSENGSSDHHHLIYTILKTKFEKFEPKKLIYLNFKQFDSEQFKLDICDRMSAVRTHAAYENNFVLF